MIAVHLRQPLKAARRRRIALYVTIVAGGTLAALGLAGLGVAMAVNAWTF